MMVSFSKRAKLGSAEHTDPFTITDLKEALAELLAIRESTLPQRQAVAALFEHVEQRGGQSSKVADVAVAAVFSGNRELLRLAMRHGYLSASQVVKCIFAQADKYESKCGVSCGQGKCGYVRALVGYEALCGPAKLLETARRLGLPNAEPRCLEYAWCRGRIDEDVAVAYSRLNIGLCVGIALAQPHDSLFWCEDTFAPPAAALRVLLWEGLFEYFLPLTAAEVADPRNHKTLGGGPAFEVRAPIPAYEDHSLRRANGLISLLRAQHLALIGELRARLDVCLAPLLLPRALISLVARLAVPIDDDWYTTFCHQNFVRDLPRWSWL